MLLYPSGPSLSPAGGATEIRTENTHYAPGQPMARREARCFMNEYLFVNPAVTRLFKGPLNRVGQNRPTAWFKDYPSCSAVKADAQKRLVGKDPTPALCRRPTTANHGQITSPLSQFRTVSFHHAGVAFSLRLRMPAAKASETARYAVAREQPVSR
jgi:hypothetical protein